jgi:cytochrome b
MLNFIESSLTHWKTTLAGASLAGFHVIQNGANWHSLIMAAIMAFAGAALPDGQANSK